MSALKQAGKRVRNPRNGSSKEDGLELIPNLLAGIFENEKFHNITQLRCNQMTDGADDLSAMEEKTYTSFADFKSDIKKFTTYCRNKFPYSKTNEKSIKELIKLVNTNVQQIKICPQCYKNAIDHDNSMVELCNPPHILVWAQTKGYNYWPAKLMTVTGKTAHVIYFAEYLKAKVPTNKCFIYSEQRPDKKIVNRTVFNRSLQDAATYVENIVKKYGCFNYANGKVPLNPKQLAQHRRNMFEHIQLASSTPQIAPIGGISQQKPSEAPKQNSSSAVQIQQNETTLTASSTPQITPIGGISQQKPSEVPKEKSPKADKTQNLMSTVAKKHHIPLEVDSNHAKKRRINNSSPVLGMGISSSGSNENQDQDHPFPVILNSIVTNAKNIMDAYPKLTSLQDEVNKMKDSLVAKESNIKTKDAELVQLNELITTTKSKSTELLKAKNDQIEELKNKLFLLETENAKLKEDAKSDKMCFGCGATIEERRYCRIECVESFFENKHK